MPSARVCSRPNGPVRLGPGRCCIRPMTRRSNQITSSVVTSRKTKISSGLDQRRSTTVSSVKSAVGLSTASAAWQAALRAATCEQAHAAPPLVRSGRRRRRRRRRLVAHRAGRASRSAARPRGRACRSTTTGSVIRPASVDTATRPPSPTPTLGGRGGRQPGHAGGCAVPARNGSPSCSRPASSSRCQVASTAWPAVGLRRLAGRHGRGRGTRARPRRRARRSSARTAASVAQPEVRTSISSASRSSTR